MHKLLFNQLRRHKGDVASPPIHWAEFIRAIDAAYEQADEDRVLLERSLELTSQELLERNEHLRRDIESRDRSAVVQILRAEKLKKQNAALVELARSQTVAHGYLKNALQTITEVAARNLEVERVGVWLLSEDRKLLRCQEVYTLESDQHSSGAELRTAGYPGYFRALERDRAIVANDARMHADTREFTDSYLVPLGITSMLDVALRKGGHTVGVLCLEHIGTMRTWTTEEQAFAGSLADLVSLSLESWDRRRAEEELERSLSILRATLDSSADGVLVVDDNGRVISFNRRFLDMWKIPESVMLTRDDDQLLASVLEQLADPGEFMARIRELYASPQESSVDMVVFKDGRVFERSSMPGHFGGEGSGRVWGFRDVTEKLRAERELLRAKRLEAAGQLAGQIAHDFNNLLSPLLAYPAVLRTMFPTDERTERILDDLESASRQIAEINQQLLTLGRRGHYNIEPMDINRIVDAAIRGVEIPDTMQIIRQMADKLLPLKGGAAQIMRVLANLISNAIDATDGKGTIICRTSNVYLDTAIRRYNSIVVGEYVRINLADDGPGIPADIIERIFEPFFTTKKTNKKSGSGLGLSVVHSVVEDHKGYIDLQTAGGTGTTFSIYLPVDRSAALPESTASSLPRGANQIILIVDDDPTQRRVAAVALEGLGYRVVTKSSGEEAVEHLRENTCDLVVLDMIMDGIDGAEALRRIRNIHPHLPTLILSGFAQCERVRTAMELGALAFIPKPIDLKVFARAVADALSVRHGAIANSSVGDR